MITRLDYNERLDYNDSDQNKKARDMAITELAALDGSPDELLAINAGCPSHGTAVTAKDIKRLTAYIFSIRKSHPTTFTGLIGIYAFICFAEHYEGDTEELILRNRTAGRQHHAIKLLLEGIDRTDRKRDDFAPFSHTPHWPTPHMNPRLIGVFYRYGLYLGGGHFAAPAPYGRHV